jgi:hypothetical protein
MSECSRCGVSGREHVLMGDCLAVLRSRLTIAQSKCAKSDSIRAATLGTLRRMGLRLAAERTARKLAETKAHKAALKAATAEANAAGLRIQLDSAKAELAKARKASSRAARWLAA